MMNRNNFIKEEFKNFKVVIIDDTPANLQLLNSILAPTGIAMAFAQDGQTGLSVIRAFDPDIILLDVNMPEMDGFTMCKELKKQVKYEDVPVIFLSARTDSQDIVDGFELGAVDYITKPFNKNELVVRMATQLELRQSKQKLSKLITELKKSNTDKIKMLTLISHDLRSPFAGLLGLSRIMNEKFDDLDSKELKEMIEMLYLSLTSQFNFLESLLSWGNLMMDRNKQYIEQVHLNTLLTDTHKIFVNNAKTKDIELKLNLPNYDCYTEGDNQQIFTAVRNIVSNALKFTPSGGKIEVILSKMDNNLKIDIIDTGIGMSQVDLNKLFKIDSIFTTPGTQKESGSGMGLLLCKEMIEKNNGSLEVQSKLGVGTKFTITIPSVDKKDE